MSAATTVPQSPEGPTHMPRWDLTPFYPSPDSDACARDQGALIREIADLTALFDRHHIGQRAPGPLDDALVALFDEVDRQSQADPQFRGARLYTRLSAAEVRRQLIAQQGDTDAELPTAATIGAKLNAWGYSPKKVATTQPPKKVLHPLRSSHR